MLIVYEIEYLVVCVYLEIGECMFVFGYFVQWFKGLLVQDFVYLLQVFYEYVMCFENIVCWNWWEGDVVIWDNCVIQYYVINDYGDVCCVVCCVIVYGDVLVGIDGCWSVLLKGLGVML